MSTLVSNARYLKEILCIITILFASSTIFAQLTSIDENASRIGYAGRLVLLWSALLAAAYIRPAVLRWATAILFSLSAYLMTVFEYATTQFLTYDAFITMVNSTGAEADALVQNRSAFISALGPTLLLLVAMGLAPSKRPPLLPAWAAAGWPWLAVTALATVLFIRGGDGAAGLPPSFTPIAYLALAGYEAANDEIGAREPVRLKQVNRPLTRNIVLVIDESIAGQYLDINSANGVPTPLSRPWPDIDIHNYGLAVAVTNCSVSSNVTLRFGGTRNNYRQTIATQPSIWAYARSAGMRTVYIDSQGTGGELLNYMTPTERAEIDRFVQFDDLSLDQRDMAAARSLISELADPMPKFILVNKSGAHFPIHQKYPDTYLHYSPALARGGQYRDILTGKQPGFTGSSEDWVRYRNSYRNTLLWTVGAFFNTLLREADFSDATLIYTSDHGQNLHEDGSPGLYTHCGPDPIPAEGVVPLVVLEGRGAPKLNWQRNIAHNRDRSSHYMIFPTVLKLMGYDTESSLTRYGPSIDAPSIDPGTFNTRFNARLNRQPKWLPVDRARISHPPRTDGANAALDPPRKKNLHPRTHLIEP